MRLAENEIREQKLSAEHHDEARRELLVTGYVVLETVLPAERVATLKTAFFELLARNMQEVGDNRGKARQGGVPLPFEAPFTDPEVMGNALALDLFADLLDEDLTGSYFSSDTPLPGSDYQPAHRDGKDLFPGLPITLPPYMYELNIPLVDFRLDNGPLEVWPHTHLVNSVELSPAAGMLQRPVEEVRAQPMQRFADGLGPRQALMPAGSFLLRDPRMWHRGSPNRSDEPRPMLSLAYHRPWYRFNAVTIPRRVYDAWPERLRRVYRLASIDGELSREFS